MLLFVFKTLAILQMLLYQQPNSSCFSTYPMNIEFNKFPHWWYNCIHFSPFLILDVYLIRIAVTERKWALSDKNLSGDMVQQLHLLLLRKTQVQFSAPTCWLRMTCISSSTKWMPTSSLPGTSQIIHTHTCRENTNRHEIFKWKQR